MKENLIFATIFVIALTVLAFIGGSVLTILHVPPATIVEDGIRGAKILYHRARLEATPYKASLRWYQLETDQTGVTKYDPEQAWPGYTIYTSGEKAVANLLSMTGEIVHSWQLPFDEAWPQVDHLAESSDPRYIYWRNASVFPNGDLLAIYEGEGVTPYGHGLVKVDKDSNLIWKYSMGTHHDMDIAPDGNIYVLTHAMRMDPVPQIEYLEPPIVDDMIIILSPDGEELDRINILEAFAVSGYSRAMRLAPDNRIGDYLHTNSIRFVTEELASVHPYAKPGQILINVRNFPLIALIDRNTRKVEWALTGPWVGQHDAEMLPNGNMLIFDNRGNIKPGQQESRIIEFNPMTQEIVWEYGGNKAEPFASSWRSAQQRLPNNNTLITESNYGRLLEVTSAGEIVWEYRNPVRGGDNNEYVAVVCQAKRIAANELRFLQ